MCPTGKFEKKNLLQIEAIIIIIITIRDSSILRGNEQNIFFYKTAEYNAFI